jgi:hypothetical protein
VPKITRHGGATNAAAAPAPTEETPTGEAQPDPVPERKPTRRQARKAAVSRPPGDGLE